jgi:hypothetical protein
MSELAVYAAGLKAGADYSDADTYVGTCMKIDTNDRQVALQTSSGGAVLGLLQNDPKSGEAAHVAVGGIAPGRYGAAVTRGDLLMCEVTTGRLVTATAALYAIAMALESGADGELHDVLIIHQRVPA